ncbi:hypothetical protein [Gynuella sp.]|uniref:hypothetical protein n=1 Tax=Gynuella sp. TaxID=2969146 RepID=UPI003D0EEC7C
MMTEQLPDSPTVVNSLQLELIRQDLCIMIATINGGQAIALELAESDDETTANIARAAYGFLDYLSIRMDGIYSDLGNLK